MSTFISDSTFDKAVQESNENTLNRRTTNLVRPLETLDILENDPEYVQTAERFLKSINEGGTVDDLYEYFRDADWNLARGAYRAFQELPNLTQEQKDDYRYLKNRFDNADMGGFNQYVKAASNIGVDILTDPTLILSTLFAIPTGGMSFGARAALGKTTQLGLKQIGKSFVQDKPLTQYMKKQGLMNVKGGTKKAKRERLNAIRKYYNAEVKKNAAIGAAEGAVWDGMHTYLAQERDDVEGIDLRRGLDYYEIGLNTAFGTFLGGVLGGGFSKGLDNLPNSEVRKNLLRFSDENALTQSDEVYKLNKAKDIVISNTIGKPTTRFLTMAQDSETLKDLLKIFRYDAFKGQEDMKLLGRSYKQELDDYAGKYNVAFEDALGSLIKRNGKMLKEDEDILFRLMQTHPNEWRTVIPEATTAHKEAARNVRVVADMVLKDGNDVGILRRKLRRGPNDWMPRRWRWSVVEERRDELAQIMADDNAVTIPYNVVSKYLPEGEVRDQFKTLENLTVEYEKLVANFETMETGELQKNIQAWASYLEPEIPANIYSRVDWKDVKFDSLAGIADELEVMKRNIIKDYLPDTKEIRQEKLRVANKVIDDMLDKKNLIDTLDIETLGTMAPSSFSPRSLFMIDDKKIKDFIDTDFNMLMRDYFNSSARLFARTKTLGVNLQDFKNRWIGTIDDPNSIRGQLHAAGKPLSARDATELQKLYEYSTGLGKQYFDVSAANNIADFAKVSQQIAHLPLATLSSLTEVLIPLTRAGGGEYISALGKTIKNATTQQFNRTKQLLQNEHNLTSDEAYREMHRVYLALEQAVAQRVDSLTGEGIQSVVGRKIQENFFKYTGLSGWTRTVQLAAFTMGKDIVRRNLKDIIELEKLGTSIDSGQKRKLKRATQELLDLGININSGKEWIINRKGRMYNRDSAPNPRTGLYKWDSFYENQVMQGAARFAGEVILDPAKAAVTRPHIQQHPVGTVLFQFLGYPTAFTNTVLKNFIIQAKRDPVHGTGKVLGTALLMTGVAGLINAARSNGESLEKEYPEMITDAVSRWGGLGYGDYLYNIRKNQEYGSGVLGSVAKGLTGPVVGDVVDMMLYRKGLGEVATTNLPFYSALDTASFLTGKATGEDVDFKKDVKDFGKSIDYETGIRLGTSKPKVYQNPYSQYTKPFREYLKPYQNYVKGGEVYHKINNASINPSDKIDPYTQLPYNVTAGVVIEDREDEPRQRYSLGRIVRLGLSNFVEESNFTRDQILQDPVYQQISPHLARLQFQPKKTIIEDFDSGSSIQINPNETNRYADLFIEDSFEKATVNFPKSTNNETPTYGYRVNLHGEEGVKGKARIKNPFEWEGDIQDAPVFLLWQDKFLDQITKGRKETEVFTQKSTGAKIDEETLKREGPEGKEIVKEIDPRNKFISIKKDMQQTLSSIDMINFEQSIFDKDEVVSTIIDGFNREFFKLMEDEGYDSIKFYGEALTNPDVIKVMDLTRRKDYIIDDYGNLVDIGKAKYSTLVPSLTSIKGTKKYVGSESQLDVESAVDRYNKEVGNLESPTDEYGRYIDSDSPEDLPTEETDTDIDFEGVQGSDDPFIKRTPFQSALMEAGIDAIGKTPGYQLKTISPEDTDLLPESEEELRELLTKNPQEIYTFYQDLTKGPAKSQASGTGIQVGLREEVEKLGYDEPAKLSDPERDLQIEYGTLDSEKVDDENIVPTPEEPLYETLLRSHSKANLDALSSEAKKNPNYLLFHEEQFFDTESYSPPTQKEINFVNNETSVETRKEILDSYTSQNVPAKVYDDILSEGRTLNLVTTATESLPLGKIISYKIPSDQLIKDLEKTTNQPVEFQALKENYNAYKFFIGAEYRDAADLDPIVASRYVDFPEIPFMRIDTIPGKKEQIIHSHIQTKDQVISSIKNSSSANPSEFWMHPPDNDIFSLEARTWRLINIEKEDLLSELSSNALSKHKNDSFGMAPEPDTTIQESNMLSGGAIGADTDWEIIGLNYGLQPSNIKHYYVQGQNIPKGNFPITKELAAKADPYIKKASKSLDKKYPTKTMNTNNNFRRTFYNVQDSDGVFAITELNKSKKTAKGGTGWGVQMAIDLNKPTYVFDQEIKKWHVWDRNKGFFVVTETPRLTKNFSGIGMRKINSDGKQAIKDVYEKSSKEGVKVIPKLLTDAGRRQFIAFDFTPEGKLIGIENRGRREALEEFILEEQNRGTVELDEKLEEHLFRPYQKENIQKYKRDSRARIYAPIPSDWYQRPEWKLEGLSEEEKFATLMSNVHKETGGAYGTDKLIKAELSPIRENLKDIGKKELSTKEDIKKEATYTKGTFKNLSSRFNEFSNLIKENSSTKQTSGRDVLWFGSVDYEYTGAKHKAQDMPEEFSSLARQLEQKLNYPEGYFNSVLTNLYPKGKGIGAHADDEAIFVRDNKTIGAVATINLGGTSKISIKNKKTGKQIERNVLDGDLYVMPDGTFQTENLHAVGPADAPRISMTFRHIPKSVLEKLKSKDATKKETPKTLNIWHGTGENAELSNLALRPFIFEGKGFASVEHAYQTTKSGYINKETYDNPKWLEGGVKIQGKRLANTKDNWNVALMEYLMKESFDQNEKAKQKLLDTGDAILTHNQDKTVWNELFPKILMEIRESYKREKNFKGGTIRKNYDSGGMLDDIKLFGEEGLIFDHTNPMDYLMFVPGLGAIGVGAKALSKIYKTTGKLRSLPKTQYHGGHDSILNKVADKVGVYTSPDHGYASAFMQRGKEAVDKYGETGLFKLDFSKLKNIELTDKPSKKLRVAIEKQITQNPEQDRINRGLKRMFLEDEIAWGVRGSKPLHHKESLDWLREQGVELITDSETLKKGTKAKGSDAEYFLLKDFPKKKLSEKEIKDLQNIRWKPKQDVLDKKYNKIKSDRAWTRLGKGMKPLDFNEGGEVSNSLQNFLDIANEAIKLERKEYNSGGLLNTLKRKVA